MLKYSLQVKNQGSGKTKQDVAVNIDFFSDGDDPKSNDPQRLYRQSLDWRSIGHSDPVKTPSQRVNSKVSFSSVPSKSGTYYVRATAVAQDWKKTPPIKAHRR